MAPPERPRGDGSVSDDFAPRSMRSFSAYLSRRRDVFLLAYVGYFACYLVRNNVKVTSDLLSREHGWTPTEIGYVLTAFTLTYGVGKFLMGIVVDRTSLRTTFSLALGVSAVACILMGFVPHLTFLFLCMAVIGLVQGACAPAALSVIGGWYPNELRGSRVAVWNTSQNLGAGALPLIISGSLAVAGPNNLAIAFWLPGLIALGASFWYWRRGGERPWREGFPTLSQMFGPRGTPQLGRQRTESYWSVMRHEVLTSRIILTVATINALLYFIRFGIVNWAPIYLAREKGFTLEQTSFIFGFIEWAAIPGSLVFALIARRWPNRMSVVGSICIVMLGVAIMGYVASPGFVGVSMFAMALGALIYGPQLIVNIMTLNFVSARVAGVAVGFVGLGGYLVGETGANLVLPVVAENSGWGPSLMILVVVSVICAGFYASLRSVEREIIKL
jgi:OPA family glycerol-3-phosphate transporter-like MFS transporter